MLSCVLPAGFAAEATPVDTSTCWCSTRVHTSYLLVPTAAHVYTLNLCLNTSFKNCFICSKLSRPHTSIPKTGTCPATLRTTSKACPDAHAQQQKLQICTMCTKCNNSARLLTLPLATQQARGLQSLWGHPHHCRNTCNMHMHVRRPWRNRANASMGSGRAIPGCFPSFEGPSSSGARSQDKIRT